MRTRIEILKDLVSLHGKLETLQLELSCYPWDVEEPYWEVKKRDIQLVLQRCVNEEISFTDIEEWANMIECREDLDFESEKLQEIIFELANPEINGALTKERLTLILSAID